MQSNQMPNQPGPFGGAPQHPQMQPMQYYPQHTQMGYGGVQMPGPSGIAGGMPSNVHYPAAQMMPQARMYPGMHMGYPPQSDSSMSYPGYHQSYMPAGPGTWTSGPAMPEQPGLQHMRQPQVPPNPQFETFMHEGYHSQQMPHPLAAQIQQQSQQAAAQSSQFPQSVLSNHESANTSSSHAAGQIVKEFMYASDIATNCEQYNVGELCVLGKELVNELGGRTSVLCAVLKRVTEKKPKLYEEEPELLLAQCRELMDKIVEVRLCIEKKINPETSKMSGDDYIAFVAAKEDKEAEEVVPEPGQVLYKGRCIPVELHKKYQVFDENRKTINKLNCELKRLDWMTWLGDPEMLKNVDKTSSVTSTRELP